MQEKILIIHKLLYNFTLICIKYIKMQDFKYILS